MPERYSSPFHTRACLFKNDYRLAVGLGFTPLILQLSLVNQPLLRQSSVNKVESDEMFSSEIFITWNVHSRISCPQVTYVSY